MTPFDAALLFAGGLLAGVFNTLAGGGSLFSVPLLVLVGLPGTLANGTNRLGIFAQSVAAGARFQQQGVSGLHEALPVAAPIALGSLAGAFLISTVTDQTFERLFGLLMVVLLVPILWRPVRPAGATRATSGHWSPAVSFFVFLAIGFYGGAFQAGVGIALVLALSHAGYDLVHANSIKVVVNAGLSLVALAVFFFQGQVAWPQGLALAGGYALGGEIGARLAVRGGERLIRPVLATAVLLLAGRMIGVY